MMQIFTRRFHAAVVVALTINLVPFGHASAASECECRAAGRQWSLGEKTCLNGSLYLCSMNQNVTTWQKTGDTCPSASLLHSNKATKNLALKISARL